MSSDRDRRVRQAGVEVWPAYVDALSAAFVFVLLLFFVVLIRDVRTAEEKEARIKQIRRRDLASEAQQHAWTQSALANTIGLGALVNDWNSKLDISPIPCALDTNGIRANIPNRMLSGTVRCRLDESTINFGTNRVEPQYAPPILLQRLQAFAGDLQRRTCRPGSTMVSWCVRTLEVHGHADCARLWNSSRTEWELSSDRAGQVLRDILERQHGDEIYRQTGLRPQAVGHGASEPVDNTCDCRRGSDPCHDRNRRVDIIFQLDVSIPPDLQTGKRNATGEK
jgi:hypothetical protein